MSDSKEASRDSQRSSRLEAQPRCLQNRHVVMDIVRLADVPILD